MRHACSAPDLYHVLVKQLIYVPRCSAAICVTYCTATDLCTRCYATGLCHVPAPHVFCVTWCSATAYVTCCSATDLCYMPVVGVFILCSALFSHGVCHAGLRYVLFCNKSMSRACPVDDLYHVLFKKTKQNMLRAMRQKLILTYYFLSRKSIEAALHRIHHENTRSHRSVVLPQLAPFSPDYFGQPSVRPRVSETARTTKTGGQ